MVFILPLLIFFFVNNIFAQEFKIEDFVPKDCGNGKYDCGYKATSKEALLAIPLSASSKVQHRGLPSSVDLSSMMPPVGSQGRQGSCVAWATTYALKSYQEKIERKHDYDISWSYSTPSGTMSRVFSPAFVYNQINGGRDQGSYIGHALDLIVKKGVPPYSSMPYNQNDFRTQPNSRHLQEASKYKASRYSRIDPTNTNAIKAELAKGNPVVFGMKIDNAFHSVRTEIYDSPGGGSMGGHAMTLVGYDDSKRSAKGHQGAYRLINSWSSSWGDKGYAWVSYRVFAAYTHDAWVLEDIQDSVVDVPTVVEVTGLAPPKTVEASKGSYSDRILVSWTKVNNADAYIVYKYIGNSSNYSDELYSETNLLEDSNIEVNLSYRYRIVSVKMDGDETVLSDLTKSPEAEGFAKSQTDNFPAKVSGLEVELGSNGIVELKWNPISGAKSYEIFKYIAATQDWKKLTTSTNSQAQDKSPIRGDYNFYVVRAANSAGAGEWSESEGVFVANPAATKPAIVQNVKASRGRVGGIDIEWSPSAGASNYFLFRYSVLNRSWDKGTPINGTSMRDTSREANSGLPVGYVIVAGNQYGYSDYSQTVYGLGVSGSFYQRGSIVMPPEKVRYKLSGNQIRIDWDKVQGAEEYYVFLRKPKSKKWEFVASTGQQMNYTYTIPEANSLYAIAIKSKAAMGGESILSKAIPAFINQPGPKPKHRFMPEAGIENFTGKWEGSLLVEKSAPKTIQLIVKSEGNKFTAEFSEQGKKTVVYKGTYAANSHFLQTKDFFLEAKSTTGQIPDVLSLRVNNSFLSKNTVELGLMRMD